MKYLFKKTNELTNQELLNILSLFNEIFSQERSLKELTAQYTSNPYLNSYHVLSIENTRIVGHFAFVPSDYLVDGKREKFVVGIDSFVVDGFRDGMVLLESYLCALDNFKQRGVSIILGFPDTHVNKVYSKGKLYSNIGQLNIYILPYRVGGIYKKLKYFNLLSAALSMLPSTVGSLIASREVATYRIQKEPLSFNSERYSYGKSNYGRVNIKDFEFMFRIKLHEGIRTLFLIDVSIKSARNFNLVVRYLIKHHRADFDLIMYVGNLKFKCHGLYKLPSRYSPKEFHVVHKILDKNLDKALFDDIRNFDLNFSNFDLV